MFFAWTWHKTSAFFKSWKDNWKYSLAEEITVPEWQGNFSQKCPNCHSPQLGCYPVHWRNLDSSKLPAPPLVADAFFVLRHVLQLTCLEFLDLRCPSFGWRHPWCCWTKMIGGCAANEIFSNFCCWLQMLPQSRFQLAVGLLEWHLLRVWRGDVVKEANCTIQHHRSHQSRSVLSPGTGLQTCSHQHWSR